MNESVFRQLVGHHDSHTLALIHLDRRTWHAAIEAVDVHVVAGQELSLNRHRNELKFFYPVDHLPWKLLQIGSHKRRRSCGSGPETGHEFAEVVIGIGIIPT